MHDLVDKITPAMKNRIGDILYDGLWANCQEHYWSDVKQLEGEFASYIGVDHAIAVSNGTAALITALHAIGLKPGDEVLVPSFTYFADVEAILFHGAKPVFVDIHPDTYTMSMNDLLHNKVTNKTKFILPVHLFGLPCNMDNIKGTNLKIIEDCSQAHGAEYKGKKVGSIGDIGCFSLYPTKNAWCGGEGGIITTDDEKLAKKMRSYINHGYSGGLHHTLGYNFRMSEVQAAIARYSLSKLDENNRKRNENALKYYSNLPINHHIDIPDFGNTCNLDGSVDRTHVFHCYTIQVDNPEALGLYLKGHGIETTTFYDTPCHEQPVIKQLGLHLTAGCEDYPERRTSVIWAGPWRLPNTDRVKDRVIQIPVGPHLTTEQVNFVIEKIKEFYET